MPKHNITVTLLGTDGNAMMLIGEVRKALRKNGVTNHECSLFVEEAMSGDYDHVLQTCMEWVEVR
jgi:hypothetical protein